MSTISKTIPNSSPPPAAPSFSGLVAQSAPEPMTPADIKLGLEKLSDAAKRSQANARRYGSSDAPGAEELAEYYTSLSEIQGGGPSEVRSRLSDGDTDGAAAALRTTQLDALQLPRPEVPQ